VHAALLLVALIYGFNYNIAKLIIPHYLNPSAVILLRVVAVSFLLGLWHLLRGTPLYIAPEHRRRLLWCALLGVVVNQLLFFEGLARTSATNASVIMTMTPIFVLLLSLLMGMEQATIQRIIGILLGAFGGYVLLTQGQWILRPANVWGDLMVLGNALSYSAYLVLVKPLMRRYHPLVVMFYVFTLGILGVLPFGYTGLASVSWQQLPWFVLVAITYVLLATTLTAYSLNAWALQYTHASVVGFYIYFQPLVAATIDLWQGKTSLTVYTLMATALIFTGVFLVNIQNSRSRKKQQVIR
jgi:drug/metabolite transporter (DMT)-like permease